jgi:nicotinate-nucleotide adenylyltransferase
MKKHLKIEGKKLLFFGSFNPFHNGHRHLALGLSERYSKSECFFILTPNNPHKKESNLMPFKIRLNILRNALTTFVSTQLRFHISQVEKDMPKPNYTYLTLRKFKKVFQKDELTVVMGLDAFNSLPSWKNFEELKEYNYCVIGRNGDEIKDIGVNVEAYIPFEYDLSSTIIRNAFENNTMYPNIEEDVICKENMKILKRYYNLKNLTNLI